MSLRNLKVVGKRIPRKDAILKVTGRAIYNSDLALPDLLYAKILRSPYAHARVVRVDTRDAERMRGVRAVLTYDGCPKTRFNTKWKRTEDQGFSPGDQYILEEKVRYVSDGVAAVAAESPGIAADALKLIRVKYEELPAVFDPEEALKPGSPKVHSEGNLAGHFELSLGDVEKGFKEADHVHEGRYQTPRQQHASMETHGSTAQFDPVLGSLTVWTSTQSVFGVRFVVSVALGIPEDKIRVIQTCVGGGFGSKDDVLDEPLVAFLSEKTGGAPVQIQYSREEDMMASRTRHPTTIYLKTGVKKDGSLTARQATAYYDTGAYSSAGPIVTLVAGKGWLRYYNCANARYDGYCVYTNTLTSGAFRGFGQPQNNFATEIQMDEIAEEIGIDPLELRLKNAVGIGDLGPGMTYRLGSAANRDCMIIGARMIGWNKKRGIGGFRGVGMGQCIKATGIRPTPDKSTVRIRANSDGTFTLLAGGCEIGQGLGTVLAQIVAEELGARFDDIEVVLGDTQTETFDLGAHASKSTYVLGGAAKLAAADMKRQVLRRAAEILGVSASELESEQSQVFVKGDRERKVEFSEIIKLECEKGGKPLVVSATYEPPTNAPYSGAQFAEVEVDPDTGRVRVLRIVSVNDSGRIINPLLAEAQVEGSIMQGLGYALMENLDIAGGKVLNANLKDYQVPTASDVPDISQVFVYSVEPTGPFGAKGLGEGVIVSVAPAIVNAIYDATGIRFREIPITPEMVHFELKKRNRKGLELGALPACATEQMNG
jgi:xanthine dehydrogenase molybdenum-binding subunit